MLNFLYFNILDLDSDLLTQPSNLPTLTQMNTDTKLVTVKQEPIDVDTIQSVTVTTTRPGQTLLKQPTIILATTSATNSHNHTTSLVNHTACTNAMNTKQQDQRLVLPKVEIKVERTDEPYSPEHIGKHLVHSNMNVGSVESVYNRSFMTCWKV